MQDYAENIYRILFNFTSLYMQKGIRYAVISPGSRSAPLAITLSNSELECFVINDERSAAYIALGIAIQTKSPVILVCTSGTAALNFAPAVAEAFFQEVPLLVLTADRPVEWVGQNENQTIYQNNLYEPNVRKSFQLNIEFNDREAEKEAYRIISQAINTSMYPVPGPVHVNIPLREPLYPSADTSFHTEDVKSIELLHAEHVFSRESLGKIFNSLTGFRKIMILGGLHSPDNRLYQYLSKITQLTDIVFIPDITSNLHGVERSIDHAEEILKNLGENDKNEFKPDLLITFGGQIVSNILKSYLRTYAPDQHWHIDYAGRTFDSFQALTRIFPVEPAYFFSSFLRNINKFKTRAYSGYFRLWEQKNRESAVKIDEMISGRTKTEICLVSKIIRHLPKNSLLHLGNSLPVRYVNNLGLKFNTAYKSISIYSNRGTSGIDGTLSTALGAALATKNILTVVTGDLSFFYDRNALWNKYLPANLKIIVLNNHGGRIFEKMPGPRSRPELNDYFITGHGMTLKDTAAQHKVVYFCCENPENANSALDKLYSETQKISLLEFNITQ